MSIVEMKRIDMQIDDKIIEALHDFHMYADDVSEWIIIKRHILLMLPSPLRKKFSRRDEKTKLQQPNELEFELMRRWVVLTGKQIIFTNDGTQGKIDPS